MNEEKDAQESPGSSKDIDDVEEVSLDFDDDTSSKDESPEEKKETYEELMDRYLRLQAEFDNYRKRMNSRFEEASQFASEGILLKVLEVVDNLNRALETDFEADPHSARAGIEAIYKQVGKLLANEQVRPIECVGEVFDPYYQNAINTINDNTLPDQTVVQEYQKGYMLREKVLRPAMVSVNRHLDTSDDASDNDTTETENNESEGDN
jgi:molecular chaperone GrpE